MAEAMNRTIVSVLMGGFGGEAPAPTGPAGETGGTVRSTSAADAAIQMAYASQVAVVPGYGMAVAQAQHAVREMTKILEEKGISVILDRKSTRLNSSHANISYAVFCLKKKK